MNSLPAPERDAPALAPALAAVATAACCSVAYVRRNLPRFPEAGPRRPNEVLDALANDDDLYHFGVGSNLSRTKLEGRSFTGRKIRPKSMEPCLIRHCRLAFNFRGAPPLEPSFGSEFIFRRTDSAPLAPYGAEECHGALIKLSARDYDLVYQSEGGARGALCGYEEIIVACEPYDETKPPVKAVALRVREHQRFGPGRREAPPSKRYMDIIREGARELGLDERYRKWLDEHPVQEVGTVVYFVGKYSTLFMFQLTEWWRGMRWFQEGHNLLLFSMYAPSTEARWRQAVGGAGCVALMLPSACLGYALSYTNWVSPILRKWFDGL
ncbi:hypothetical protein ACHAWF_017737 [Thalassiosira exigua]